MVNTFVRNQKTKTIMHRTKETELLRQKCHNLQALLSYHVKKELRLEEEVLRLVKGAIATEYTAFLGLVNEILYSLEVGATKKHLKEICDRWLQEYLGTHTTVGVLAKEINQQTGGALDSLLSDFPEFGIFEANLFACLAINVRDSLILETFELGKPSNTANEKHLLLKCIKTSKLRSRLKYLKLLQSKDCTYGKNLLSLHDLSKFSNGKPEKNKD